MKLAMLVMCVGCVVDPETGVEPVAHGAAPDIGVFRNGLVADGTIDNLGTLPAGTTFNAIYMIVNGGNAPLTLTDVNAPVSIIASSDAACAVAAQPDAFVAAGGTTLFTISVTPGGGPFTCNISIASNDPDENPYDYVISGVGSGGGTPEIAIDGPAGPVADGAEDALSGAVPGTLVAREYTISNTGTQTLVIDAVVIGEMTGATCTVTRAAPQQLGPGATGTFEIGITPSASTFRCAVAVTSNDADESPYEFAITSPVAGLEVLENGRPLMSGTTRDVGTIRIAEPRRIPLAIRNAGTSLLVFPPVGAIAVFEETGVSCAIEGGIPETMAPGQTIEIAVVIEPTETFPFSCDVVIFSNDRSHPQFALSFIGVGQPRRGRGCAITGSDGAIWGIVLLVLVIARRRRSSTTTS
jgi:hypothetical protein